MVAILKLNPSSTGNCPPEFKALITANKPALLEYLIRDLRDRVYGKRSSEHNWDMCRDHWMQPISAEWLRKHSGRELVNH